MKMKDLITTIFASVYVMISPIIPLFFLVAFVVSCDSYSQVWELKKTNKREEINYKKLIWGWLSKVVVYTIIIAFFFLFEKHIIHHLLVAFEGLQFELLITRVITGLLIYYELISIDRSYKNVTGESFIKKIKEAMVSILKFRKQLINEQ